MNFSLHLKSSSFYDRKREARFSFHHPTGEQPDGCFISLTKRLSQTLTQAQCLCSNAKRPKNYNKKSTPSKSDKRAKSPHQCDSPCSPHTNISPCKESCSPEITSRISIVKKPCKVCAWVCVCVWLGVCVGQHEPIDWGINNSMQWFVGSFMDTQKEIHLKSDDLNNTTALLLVLKIMKLIC